MNEHAWSGNESLPFSLAQRVDGACNRFERMWQQGPAGEPPPDFPRGGDQDRWAKDDEAQAFRREVEMVVPADGAAVRK